jgi:hypothetical protein
MIVFSNRNVLGGRAQERRLYPRCIGSFADHNPSNLPASGGRAQREDSIFVPLK